MRIGFQGFFRLHASADGNYHAFGSHQALVELLQVFAGDELQNWRKAQVGNGVGMVAIDSAVKRLVGHLSGVLRLDGQGREQLDFYALELFVRKGGF